MTARSWIVWTSLPENLIPLKKNIKARLAFAKIDWTVADWKNIVLPNESKIKKVCPDILK